MKTLFKMTILVVCCLTLSCSKHVEPDSLTGSKFGTAYIVSDSDVTIISVKESGNFHLDYKEFVVCYDKLEKNFANRAFGLGIVKPGLDFSLGCMAWGTSDNNMVHKDNAFVNAIYIEIGGKINSIKNLYVNDDDKGNLIHYRIIDRILYTKKLTPVEKEDLDKSIKKRIEEYAIFIY